MKKCSRCKEKQPAGNFSKNRTRSDGLSSECRGCRKLIRLQAKLETLQGEVYERTNWRRLISFV